MWTVLGVALGGAAGWVVFFLLMGFLMQEPETRGYVMRDAGGQVVVGYRTCPGEYVDRVVVTETGGAHRVLWRIERRARSTVRQIPLGRVPDGFREVVPFRPPPPGRPVEVEVRDSDGVVSDTLLRLRDLKAGHYVEAANPPDDQKPVPRLRVAGAARYGC